MLARVPATSANLGAGFDALGMALSLHAEIGVIDADGLPDGAHDADPHHLADIAFRRAGGRGQLWVRSPIPMARGLGYSAAVRVGGLLCAIAQREGEIADALADAVELEGHADNAAAAVLGGVVVTTGDRVVRVPLQLDPAIVVWVPSFTTRTDQSRTALPPSVSHADAAFNVARAAMFVAAMASGDVDALRDATDDRLHQPSRFAASPASRAAYDAALDTGAWCAWLSGSGPTVAAMCTLEAAGAVAAAMTATSDGVGHTKQLRIDHDGATIER